ncbi:hypothetical protein JCM24511_07344 [Saitozyma sp. JCM 24511]|nr:hypothetical protein JCM24511_07344 [Saitozyma sp. JCM 24511]
MLSLEWGLCFGGAVIDALLAPPNDFIILAVTRDTQSAGARRLAAKSPSIKLVQGDLDAVPALFQAARAASPSGTIWGVFSVQAVAPKGNAVPEAPEVKQGVALIDEALMAGVTHFVYSSVDRGGEQRSWDNPTPIPHFRTKHHIEQHLRTATTGTKMGWTILRPVIFMDNLTPGFVGKVLLTSLRDTLGDKPMPWIATSDIGFFGAEAFRHPARWNQRAVSLAGDEFNFRELSAKSERVTGKPAPTTFSFLGSALKVGMKEMGTMINWFRDEGYQADVAELRKLNPNLMDMETWLREKSRFPKRS